MGSFLKLDDEYGQVYMINIMHIVSLEYATNDVGEINPERIIVSLSNGEAITISKDQAEQICAGSL